MKIEGKNAVLELLKTDKTIDKILVQNGMRDEGSRALAASLTGRSDVFSSGELAFLKTFEKKKPKGKYFAVFPKIVENFDLRELIKFCICIKERLGLSPVFAPLHLREDLPLCQILAEKTEGKIFLGEAGALCRGAVFALSMRLHGAVFAASAATPFICVSDDCKTEALLGGCKAVFLGAEASAAELMRAARDVLEKRKEKKKLLGKFAEEQREMARAELERVAALFKPLSQSRE